jgi:hypothetical protein
MTDGGTDLIAMSHILLVFGIMVIMAILYDAYRKRH